MLGDVVAAVALAVLVYEPTGSPALAALTFTAAFVPYLFSGTFARRGSPRSGTPGLPRTQAASVR